jgi:opacity protein-like surface antigen
MPRLLLAAAVVMIAAAPAPAQPQKAFGWQKDYEAGKAEARRTGKPIFLVFRCEP